MEAKNKRAGNPVTLPSMKMLPDYNNLPSVFTASYHCLPAWDSKSPVNSAALYSICFFSSLLYCLSPYVICNLQWLSIDYCLGLSLKPSRTLADLYTAPIYFTEDCISSSFTSRLTTLTLTKAREIWAKAWTLTRSLDYRL